MTTLTKQGSPDTGTDNPVALSALLPGERSPVRIPPKFRRELRRMRSFIERTRSAASPAANRRTICLVVILLGSCLPAFAQIGGDRVTTFLSNALTYAQGLGIFGAGFLVIWAVANVARERPSGKQWAGAGGALLLSSSASPHVRRLNNAAETEACGTVPFSPA